MIYVRFDEPDLKGQVFYLKMSENREYTTDISKDILSSSRCIIPNEESVHLCRISLKELEDFLFAWGKEEPQRYYDFGFSHTMAE